eukprot:3859947-Amphidinium_carterae.1
MTWTGGVLEPEELIPVVIQLSQAQHGEIANQSHHRCPRRCDAIRPKVTLMIRAFNSLTLPCKA